MCLMSLSLSNLNSLARLTSFVFRFFAYLILPFPFSSLIRKPDFLENIQRKGEHNGEVERDLEFGNV